MFYATVYSSITYFRRGRYQNIKAFHYCILHTHTGPATHSYSFAYFSHRPALNRKNMHHKNSHGRLRNTYGITSYTSTNIFNIYCNPTGQKRYIHLQYHEIRNPTNHLLTQKNVSECLISIKSVSIHLHYLKSTIQTPSSILNI
jgi:hypothetical protein